MDPLAVFPPEIVQQIWLFLEPADLLSARAVAPHWLESINDCPRAWVTDFSSDWTEFLAVKKAVRGWSSKEIRRQTVKNVKDAVFTEFAYYLLFIDGTLTMFSPNGSSIRVFHRPATDLHRGEKCLLIGVDDALKEHPWTRHRTIVTDFVLNRTDDLLNTRIMDSSPNGYRCERNGDCFFSIGPEIPGTPVPCTPFGQIHFLASSAILVGGFTVKTVRLFTPESQSFTTLKTAGSSPRWIPSITVSLGPNDHFAVIAEQRDFSVVSVYHRSTVQFEDIYPFEVHCCFTADFIVMSLSTTVEAFKLSDLTQQYQLDLTGCLQVKSTTCEPWSLLRDTLAVFNESPCSSMLFHVYHLSETRSDSTANPEDVKFHPKLKLLAMNSTKDIGFTPCFELSPGYAFHFVTLEREYEMVNQYVKLVHFDI